MRVINWSMKNKAAIVQFNPKSSTKTGVMMGYIYVNVKALNINAIDARVNRLWAINLQIVTGLSNSLSSDIGRYVFWRFCDV